MKIKDNIIENIDDMYVGLGILEGTIKLSNFGTEITTTPNIEQSKEESLKIIIKKYQDVPGLSDKVIKKAVTSYYSAIERLEKNNKFTGMYKPSDYSINKFFPLMIKESMLKHKARGTNQSRGYFQINQNSKKASTDFISKKLGITREYNIKNPVDNCILGIIYHIGILEKEYGIDKDKKIYDKKKFRNAQYNCGSTRLRGLISQYTKETKNTKIYWDSFVKWIMGKINGRDRDSNKTVSEEDTTYNVQYRNRFDKNTSSIIDKSKKKKLIVYGKGKNDYLSYEKAKIFIRYVEIIEGLTNKKGDEQNTDNTDKIIETIKKGEGLITICKKHRVVKHVDKIRNYNKEKNPMFENIEERNKIPVNTEIWIPRWNSGFYTKEDDDGSSHEVDKLQKFDFKKRLESINVETNKLEGHLFILDPGHGGIDPGTCPTVTTGDNTSIQVFEAPNVLDVTYRLAREIRKNGGYVEITHYSHARGLSNKKDLKKVPDKSDIYGDTKGAVGRSGNPTLNKRTVFTKSTIEAYRKKYGRKMKGNYFISIHADYKKNTKHTPIEVMYYEGTHGTNNTGKKLAEGLVNPNKGNLNYNNRAAQSKGLAVMVIDNKYNECGNSILIELCNMNNPNGAWLLRKAKYRQTFAEVIAKSFINYVKSK